LMCEILSYSFVSDIKCLRFFFSDNLFLTFFISPQDRGYEKLNMQRCENSPTIEYQIQTLMWTTRNQQEMIVYFLRKNIWRDIFTILILFYISRHNSFAPHPDLQTRKLGPWEHLSFINKQKVLENGV
jgi:hypothetical protein